MRGAALAALALALGCGGGTPATSPRPVGLDVPPDAGTGDDDQVPAAFGTVVNAQAPAMHRCWRLAAVDDFRLRGAMDLIVSIGAGGQTAEVAIARDEPGDPVLAACVKDAWTDATWPAPPFREGVAVQVPLTFAAPDAQYVIATEDVPEGAFGNSSEARVLLDAQNTGNPAVGLGLVTFEPGYKTGLHRHEATEVVYVLAGKGHLTLKAGRPPREVVAGDAIYVPPGAPHALEALEPLTFLMAYGPAGAEQGLEGHPSGTTPVDPNDRTKRRWPMALVASTASVAPLAIGGGKGEIRILHEAATTKDATFAVSAMTAGPGMVVPSHRHDGATEVLYVLEGAATMTIAGERIDVTAGDAIQIPGGVDHAAEVAADGGPFKALQLYTPAGPEQRFKGPPP